MCYATYMETDELLQTIDTTNLTSSMTDMLTPFIWLSVALTIVFIVLYISSMLRRRKLENAIFAIQKSIEEMNERDKKRPVPHVPPTPPSVDSER